MRKPWFCSFIFLFSLFFATFVVLNVTKRIFAASESRTVRVGIYDNKPKTYLDQRGEPAGLFPEVLNHIAKQENWQLDYVYGTWEEGLARLEKGEIDLKKKIKSE